MRGAEGAAAGVERRADECADQYSSANAKTVAESRAYRRAKGCGLPANSYARGAHHCVCSADR